MTTRPASPTRCGRRDSPPPERRHPVPPRWSNVNSQRDLHGLPARGASSPPRCRVGHDPAGRWSLHGGPVATKAAVDAVTPVPPLKQNLVRVSDAAGQMRASPLSYYRQKELAAQAKRMRVLWYASGTRGVTAEEVDAVLRGARLPEKRQEAREMIARAALVEDAHAHLTSTTAKGRRLTPEVAMLYRFCTLGRPPGIPAPKGLQLGEPSWTLFSPRERAKLLDMQRAACEVRPEVKAIFDWADHDPLVSSSTLLRAATIFWGLTLVDPSWHAVSVVLHYEFRVGDIDASRLLMLTEATVAHYELLTTPSDRMVTADEGDLTSYFEEFSWSLSLVLGGRLGQPGRVQSNEAFLPWKVAAPSGELDCTTSSSGSGRPAARRS